MATQERPVRNPAATTGETPAPHHSIHRRDAGATLPVPQWSPTSTAMCLALAFLGVGVARAADFAIRDGDTVVFLGDSITAARTYGKVVEQYTLLRYPERKVHFVNAGWGGDTAAGGLARLERDVFSKGATLLTVTYGINDIGWGGKADDEHRNKYLDSIRGIVEACRKRGVRVYICSAALTAGDVKDDKGYLQKMCDEGMAISKSLGEGAIDVQRSMREVAKRVEAANAGLKDPAKKETMHAPDGIHLNDLGQLAMAVAVLKGLGAPSTVSAVAVDAEASKVVKATGCKVTGLQIVDGRVEFDRLDEGLPLNLSPLWQLQFRFIPIPEELNRYMLAVKGLPAGKYDVIASERGVGTWTSEQLAAGVNISSAVAEGWGPGGPWDAQASMLKMLTDSRNELATSDVLAKDYMRHDPARSEVASKTADVNRAIEELQRMVARPVPYHFVIQAAKKGKD